MSRYHDAFNKLRLNGEKAFIPFFVIGDPDYKTSLDLVKASIDAGADMLELGIGFSDPIADGPTIQAADIRALSAGIDVSRCFRFIADVRTFTDAPVGLLVYFNLILRRGIERFCRDAARAGVDGILAADMPIEESEGLLKASRKHGIDPIFMLAPTTTTRRLTKIVANAQGFLYLVALLGVTGARGDLHPDTLALLKRVRAETDLPLCVGFGISRPDHVRALARSGADGAIVGSAIVDIIARHLGQRERMIREVSRYVRTMKTETRPL